MVRVLGCSGLVDVLFESHRTVIAAIIHVLAADVAVSVAVSIAKITHLWSDSQGSEKAGHRGYDHTLLSLCLK